MTEFEMFQAALEIDDLAARQEFLEKSCSDDSALRRRVEALLTSHESQSQFLNVPVVEQLDSGNAPTIVDEDGSTQDEDPDVTAVHVQGLTAMSQPFDDSDDEIALGYLEPSTRADSLGRMGHYEVLEVVGRGAFGTVLRAFDDKLHRVVAIKVMAPELATTSPARKRFLREAQAAAAIRHEHVVSIYAVEEKPLPYLVMEYIPGQTLQQRLDERGPLDLQSVIRLGRQIAEGLAAAHAINLIHRDIKPGNILLETGVQERVKITDFGLARTADDASLTQSGTIAGTPMYMAPEQALGKKLDQRADLFSFGAVLYQMLSGRPPFRAANTVAVLKRVVEDTPRPIEEIIPEVPAWMCDIVSRLLEKDREQRFQTAQEVADQLARCQTELQLHGVVRDTGDTANRSGQQTVVPAPQATRTSRRLQTALKRPTNSKVLAGLVVVVAVFVGVLASGTRMAGWFDKTIPAHPSTADVGSIALLTVEQEIEAVQKEIKRRNPDFDGTLIPSIAGNTVTGFKSRGSGSITDLSPLRAMKLTRLELTNHSDVVDLTPLREMPLESLSLWRFRGFDLTALKGMPLKSLNIGGGGQELDLSPLSNLPLEFLCINSSQVSDLTPIQNLPLKSFLCVNTSVSDLTPLKNLRLNALSISMTRVSDLSPLKGMPLRSLACFETDVVDLTPLTGMSLEAIYLTPIKITTGFEILRDMKSLKKIGISAEKSWPAAEFWERYDRGEFNVTTIPFTDADVERIVALPASEQVAEVRKELMRRNPGFDGDMKPTVKNGVVTGLRFATREVTDVGPLRALKGLKNLHLESESRRHGKLSDLSPLRGLPLATLYLAYNPVSDLTPLQGMRLVELSVYVCPQVRNLSPLRGMPLKYLQIGSTRVEDLTPLQGMPLDSLHLWMTPVSDLTPLAGMPLTNLNIDLTKVSDLTPLASLPLKILHFTPQKFPQGLGTLREIRSLETIGTSLKRYSATEFWQRYDAGEFTKK